MKKKFFVKLTIAFAFCGLSTAYAQERVITGTVKVDSELVPGADVVVNNGENGTTTDENGSYSISVNVGDQVEYHYVGYKPETRIVEASTQVINVTLIEDEELLEEIIDRKSTRLNSSHVRISY